jgi:uncharacterized protein (TIGR02271 family)
MSLDAANTDPRTILVGIFDAQDDAARAVEALGSAGFGHVRIADAATTIDVPAEQRAAALRELLELHRTEELGEEETTLLQDQAAAGRTLVVLDPGDEVDRAWAILRRAGALSEEELDRSDAEPAPVPPADAAAAPASRPATLPARLELAEEALEVRTRPVHAGEVLLHRRVVVETRTIEVEVMREELVVERRPSSAARDAPTTPSSPSAEPASDSLAARFRALRPGESIRLPLVEEQVEIRKVPVVYEEVVVGKELRRERRVVREPVRRQVVRLQRRGRVVVRAPQPAADEGSTAT